jgi:ring-1,2-phenylacetyl-CoA epoxidase subunit PaaC
MEELWPFTDDLFATDACDELLLNEIHYNMKDIQQAWFSEVHDHLHACGFVLPEKGYMIRGGIAQQHTEALGHILCEMQFLQRAHPGATW